MERLRAKTCARMKNLLVFSRQVSSCACTVNFSANVMKKIRVLIPTPAPQTSTSTSTVRDIV